MKKKHPLAALALAALVLYMGCEQKTQDKPDTTDSLNAVVDTVPTRDAGAECGNLKPGQFCAQGLDFIKLGDLFTMRTDIVATVPDGVLKDTVFTEASVAGDSTSWFAKMLTFPDGKILMDADFETGERLGRIRIESGRYHHSSGLRVGSTGKEFKAFTTQAYVGPFNEYQVMEVVVPYPTSRLIFHFPLGDFAVKKDGNYTVNDIPDNSKIVRVVIM